MDKAFNDVAQGNTRFSGVEGGEDLKPRLGCEGEWSPITYLGRVAPAGLVVVAMSTPLAIAEVGLSEATLESIEGNAVISLRAAGDLVRIMFDGVVGGSIHVDGAGVQHVKPIRGRATKGGREEKGHAFVSEALAP
ncbi:unnamed protein product [Prunus brigantina]